MIGPGDSTNSFYIWVSWVGLPSVRKLPLSPWSDQTTRSLVTTQESDYVALQKVVVWPPWGLGAQSRVPSPGLSRRAPPLLQGGARGEVGGAASSSCTGMVPSVKSTDSPSIPDICSQGAPQGATVGERKHRYLLKSPRQGAEHGEATSSCDPERPLTSGVALS